MQLDEQFAVFLSQEIEKHVRLGMAAVLKKVEGMIPLKVEMEKFDISEFEKTFSEAVGVAISRIEVLESREPLKGKDAIAPTADEVAKAMKGEFSMWALGFERMAVEKLEKAIDKIEKPKDGQNGRDAINLDGFDLSLDEDGRTVKATMKAGETVIEKSIKIPSLLDRGVYKDGSEYEKGDGVTYGGSFWICQKDGSNDKPGSSDEWRLSVKKGRDGRESVKTDKKVETVKV